MKSEFGQQNYGGLKLIGSLGITDGLSKWGVSRMIFLYHRFQRHVEAYRMYYEKG